MVLFGWKYGVFIGIIDLLKAYLPVVVCLNLTQNNIFLACLVGGGVIIGHIHPFFMNFKGGKGMSSYFGMILGLDFTFGLLLLLIAAILLMITNYVAIATILILIIVPLRAYFISNLNTISADYILCLSLLSFLIFLKHMENLIKIKNGEETTFWSVFKK